MSEIAGLGLEPSMNLCGDFLEFLARVNKKGPVRSRACSKCLRQAGGAEARLGRGPVRQLEVPRTGARTISAQPQLYQTPDHTRVVQREMAPDTGLTSHAVSS